MCLVFGFWGLDHAETARMTGILLLSRLKLGAAVFFGSARPIIQPLATFNTIQYGEPSIKSGGPKAAWVNSPDNIDKDPESVPGCATYKAAAAAARNYDLACSRECSAAHSKTTVTGTEAASETCF